MSSRWKWFAQMMLAQMSLAQVSQNPWTLITGRWFDHWLDWHCPLCPDIGLHELTSAVLLRQRRTCGGRCSGPRCAMCASVRRRPASGTVTDTGRERSSPPMTPDWRLPRRHSASSASARSVYNEKWKRLVSQIPMRGSRTMKKQRRKGPQQSSLKVRCL